MSTQDASQQKNRVVYNVQDLFFGLRSGEINSPYVTGSNGEEVEILNKRREGLGVASLGLGVCSFFFRLFSSPRKKKEAAKEKGS